MNKKNELDILEILDLLQHRFPFLLIDKVLFFKKKKKLIALKNITANDFFFIGHFPEKFVFPGILTLESIAQSSCMLSILSLDNLKLKKNIYYLYGIKNAYFIRPVYPGDQMIITVIFKETYANIIKLIGFITVKNKIVCRTIILLSCIKE